MKRMSPVRSSQPQENLTDQLASLQSAFSQLESSPASASNTFSPEVLQNLLRLVQNLINQLGKGKEDAGNVSTPSDDVNGSETVGVDAPLTSAIGQPGKDGVPEKETPLGVDGGDAPLTSAIGQPGEDGIPEEEASLGVDGGDAPLTSAIGQPGEDGISKEEAPLGADDVDNGSDNHIGPDGIQSILPMNDSPSVAGLSESDLDKGSDNFIGPPESDKSGSGYTIGSDGFPGAAPMSDSPGINH